MQTVSTKPRIILIGCTGHGKTYLVNKLCKTDFAELTSDSSSSTTNTIQTATFTYNGVEYEVVDAPGYFDSNNKDAPHMLALVDFLKHSTLQCCLLVSKTNFDANLQRFANAFIKANGLLENTIFVRNLASQATNEVIQLPESLFNLKAIQIANDQQNLSHLLDQIIKCKPTKLSTLMPPQTLFKQPIEDVKSSEVEEYVTTKEETIQKVERIIDTQVDKGHSEPQYEWIRKWGINTNRKRKIGDKWIPNIVTTYKDAIVDKKVNVDIVNKYKLYYATRQDGVVDIYKKEFIEQKQIVKESTT